MTTATAAKRPHLKSLNLSFGLLSMTGNVMTVKKANSAKEENFKMVCPLHADDPHGVKQRYACEHEPDGETFLPGECLKGRETDDGMVIVSAEAAKSVRESDLPEKTLDLRAHPYEPATTFAFGNAYVFVPDAAHQFYSVLLQLIDEQGVIQTESGAKMLVGLVSFRKGSESFVRAERWGSQIVLRELLRPEDVDQFPTLDGTVDTKHIDLARQLIDAQSEDFDPETYKASVRDRIAALVEAAKNGEVDLTPKTKAEPKVADISALLEQSLAAAKAKKGG